jgi:hypothetical protein
MQISRHAWTLSVNGRAVREKSKQTGKKK